MSTQKPPAPGEKPPLPVRPKPSKYDEHVLHAQNVRASDARLPRKK